MVDEPSRDGSLQPGTRGSSSLEQKAESDDPAVEHC